MTEGDTEDILKADGNYGHSSQMPSDEAIS